MKRWVLKLVGTLALAAAIVLAGLWVLGPREPANLALHFDPATIGDDPAAYLAREEADVPNLRPEAGKAIVWAYPASRARTPLAIVYVHGFSASRNELRPLPDAVAKRLGANLVFARLSGHGRDGPAMAEATVNDWWNDLAEALAVARRVGERVVVIGNSTGGTLAMLGATDPALRADVEGLVLISPNFGVAGWRDLVLDMPFGRRLAPTLFGEEWGTGTDDPRIAAVWTTRYPSVALLTMGALVRATLQSGIEAVRLPALFVYAPEDKVVDPAKIRAVIDRWQGPKAVEEVTDAGDSNGHILAGDIVSPATTERLAERIAGWIAALPAN